MTAYKDHVPPQPSEGKNKTLVVCDFDGTVCTVDIGNRVLNRFTDNRWDDINRGYCTDEIGSKEAYTRGAPIFKGAREQVLAYVLETERVDPYFVGFYRFCCARGIDLKIASDGFDFYIEAILGKYDLSEITFFSNKAVFREDGTLFMTFPQANKDCGKCGTCKNSIIERNRDAYGRIIYVGDGYSDVCPSKNADLVFAKSILYEKCMENKTACIRYENFRDVQQYMMDND